MDAPENSTVAKYEMVERAILRLGFPTFMVIVGLLFYAGIVGSPVTRIEAMLVPHTTDAKSLLRESRKQTRLLHQMCLVSTKNAAECLDAVTLPIEESKLSALPQ